MAGINPTAFLTTVGSALDPISNTGTIAPSSSGSDALEAILGGAGGVAGAAGAGLAGLGPLGPILLGLGSLAMDYFGGQDEKKERERLAKEAATRDAWKNLINIAGGSGNTPY